MRRVAVIFDNQARPETTGLYCRRALGELLEVEHFLPGELARVPRAGFDLYLHVDDGLGYRLPEDLRPAAFWAIDTHMDFAASLRKAGDCDFVFAAQKQGAAALREAGLAARWLPLACDPVLHGRQEAAERYDVAFVGRVMPGRRAELLELIGRRYPNCFRGRCYFEQMAAAYSASRTVFNCSVAGDLNMRVFEALASGSLLLTDRLEAAGLEELFGEERHLATYGEAEELLEKLAFYLKRPQLRRRIAEAGRQEVLARHTYRHRMIRLLETVGQAEETTRVVVPAPVKEESRQGGVSACLLAWKRPENLRRIVHRLQAEPLIEEILVWNNNPETPLELHGGKVRVIHSERNLITYGRYLCAGQARHPVIYTQDDDCLVENIDRLYAAFRADPERIAHALKPGHLARNGENRYGDAQMALLGWGAFFKREWIEVLEEYLRHYSRDGLLLRKADRIFSLLLNRPHQSLPAEVIDLPGAEGPEALSVRPDHQELSRQAVERALAVFSGKRQQPAAGPDDRLSDPAYFECDRPEVLALVPESAGRVLDLGCGAGRLGTALKQRQPAEVTGVERDRPAAEAARERLDHIVSGDLESGEVDFPAESFDCVVCADILEHLRDPLAVLRRIRQWLTPQGTLVASIPNTRHHSVVRALLAGNWTYEAAGLLDQDHLRFFTRREIEKLLFRAGLRIEQTQAVPGDGYRQWVEAGRPPRVQAGRLHLTASSPAEAEEFYVYQYLLQATPVPDPEDALTSIILVTHNQLAYTRQCLQSLRLRTEEPYELIVVDNGSSDGSRQYLERTGDVRLIANRENRGFPAAVNQGIEAAGGRQILLLNNDCLPTTGWLRRLLDALASDPAVGLAGPVSNNVSGEQQIEAGYGELAELDGFAWDHTAAHAGQRDETDRLVGFCLLVRREVFEKVGGFDERFGIGCFEDDDFCRRARAAGYRAVIARDAFVHHFGSRTFRASGLDLGAVLEENRQKYRQKWQAATGGPAGDRGHESLTPGPSPTARGVRDEGDGGESGGRRHRPAGQPAAPEKGPARRYAFSAPTGEGLRLQQPQIRLSLCMIVRDNERTLPAALASIRPWVEEMVVVDTGSTDRSPQIAEQYGARVFHFDWCDDFAAARNESLRHATGEWLFWMDSDDTIPAECGRRLWQLAAGEHPPETLGYVVQVHCPAPSENGPEDVTVVDHVKLVRNREDLRFEHRIHEQIIPAIRRAGGRVAWSDLYVVHSGSDRTTEGKQRKLERDFRLLHRELREKPEHPFTLFNLGMTYADCGRHREAADYLQRSLAASGPQESHLRKAYALLAGAYAQSDCHEAARRTCRQGLEKFPGDKELLFRLGMLEGHRGALAEAAAAYRRVLEEPGRRHFASLDRGIGGYKARHNLALVYEEMDQLPQAEEQWRRVVAEQPGYRPGWRGLGEVLLKQGKLAELEALIERLEGEQPLRRLLAARLAERREDFPAARRQLEEARREDPGEIEPLRELGRLLFQHGSPDEAEVVLEELADRLPEDAAVQHNLGTVYWLRQRLPEAIAAFRRSLQLRPGHGATWVQLSHALEAAGHPQEAAEAWRQARRLSADRLVHTEAGEEGEVVRTD